MVFGFRCLLLENFCSCFQAVSLYFSSSCLPWVSAKLAEQSLGWLEFMSEAGVRPLGDEQFGSLLCELQCFEPFLWAVCGLLSLLFGSQKCSRKNIREVGIYA